MLEPFEICQQMWSEDDGPYDGKHYRLAHTLNSPQSLSRPHPPILIGGAGERRTLRLVSRYVDACNIFDSPELAHKLDVLREHCSREGRDYSEIEKTAQMRFNLGEHGERVEATIEHLHELAELGVQVAHGGVVDAGSLRPLELMADRIRRARVYCHFRSRSVPLRQDFVQVDGRLLGGRREPALDARLHPGKEPDRP